MKKIICLLSLALFLLIGMDAYAVPARSIVRQYTQPDGSVVSLRLVGDEFSHFFLTDDDEIVVSRNNVYYFAEPDAGGYPKASKILASDPSNRSVAARSLLASVSKDVMFRASAARRAARVENTPYGHRLSAPAKAASAKWPSGIGLFPGNSYPMTGSPDALIILVQFPDQKFSLPDAKQYFTDFASKEGFSETGLVGGTNSGYKAHGSAYDYFKASSNGKFTPKFHVLGPVTMSQNMAYYGGNDSNGEDLRPEEMVEEAVKLLDATTDFSIFDNDGDGYIDNIYVIYSGLGEANGGSDDTIWPHSYTIRSYTRYDGKYLGSYACSAEIFSKSGSTILADGIGTFCHEFSHVMGLPDLYQTQYNAAVVRLTPGEYSLMDHGSYNNNSRTPPTYSIFERNAMGWADIEVLGEGEGKAGKLEHMLTSNKGYAIRAGSDNEFFLLENRQKSDWDTYLPGHGMLVWHINYDATKWNNNSPNNSTQQCVDIVEAGGSANNTSATTMKQYPFPGTKGVTSFTSSTTPALKSWSNRAIDVPLTNIKENADGTVTFDICGGVGKIDVPVCNYTDPVVYSEAPVTVILSRPVSASLTSTINYIWMYEDASDMDEGEYSSPLTFTQSAELEYWLEDGEFKSDVKSLKIIIGEKPVFPTEYTIVFKDNSSDATSDLTATAYSNQVEKGADIAAFGSCSKVYQGKQGLKFSSSKAAGTLTLNLNPDYRLAYRKIIVKAAAWVSDQGKADAAKISVNGLTAQTVSADPADCTFELDGSVMTAITLSATNRLYVKSVTFVAEGNGDDPVTPDTAATPTFSVAPGEVEQGTVVEILCETEGAVIHFTVDGTEPTADSDVYTDAIVIEEDMTIKAMAMREGWNDSSVATAVYTVKAQGGDDPVTGDDELTANFDFNTDEAYGMKLLSGNTGEYNPDGYVCQEGPITLILHGNTRWWTGKPNHLRMYKGSYITVSSLETHKITSVKLTVGTENHWDNTSHVAKAAGIDFNTTHTSGNTVLHKVEVKYAQIQTSVTEIDADSQESVYYNLQGIRVENPKGGIYIRVQGNKAAKVVL